MVEYLAKRYRMIAVFFEVRVESIHLRRIYIGPREETGESIMCRANTGHHS